MDSARLAGLNVLSLINNHAAAALQHGYTRKFGNETENVIFYDVGSSCVEVSLVKYSSFQVKELGRLNTHSQFEVKDATWDANLGVQDLDMLLVHHFADQFESKHAGSDIRSSPRAVAKLKRQVGSDATLTNRRLDSCHVMEAVHICNTIWPYIAELNAKSCLHSSKAVLMSSAVCALKQANEQPFPCHPMCNAC